MAKYLMWVLWPAFIAAAIGVGVIFTLIDPAELVVLGSPVKADRLAVYTLGFFILWAICALACGLSCFLKETTRIESATGEGIRG